MKTYNLGGNLYGRRSIESISIMENLHIHNSMISIPTLCSYYPIKRIMKPVAPVSFKCFPQLCDSESGNSIIDQIVSTLDNEQEFHK